MFSGLAYSVGDDIGLLRTETGSAQLACDRVGVNHEFYATTAVLALPATPSRPPLGQRERSESRPGTSANVVLDPYESAAKRGMQRGEQIRATPISHTISVIYVMVASEALSTISIVSNTLSMKLRSTFL